MHTTVSQVCVCVFIRQDLILSIPSHSCFPYTLRIYRWRNSYFSVKPPPTSQYINQSINQSDFIMNWSNITWFCESFLLFSLHHFQPIRSHWRWQHFQTIISVVFSLLKWSCERSLLFNFYQAYCFSLCGISNGQNGKTACLLLFFVSCASGALKRVWTSVHCLKILPDFYSFVLFIMSVVW